MKRTILTLFLALAAVLLLAGCGAKSEEKTVAKGLGLDVAGASVVFSYDSHGGFHGDGTTCIALSFPDGRLKDRLTADAGWQSLPADETVQALVWGTQDDAASVGPYLTTGDGEPLVPAVEAGYYRLIDRHSDQPAPLLERGSFNFTLGVYDSDARILYYCELDT